MKNNQHNIQFTRYLYICEGVKRTLIHTILSQEVELALFWGYELYYSGLQTETIDLLLEIYENFYSSYVKLGEFIYKKKKTIVDHTLVAIIIKNLCVKSIDNNGIEGKRPRFITVKDDQLDIFKTKTIIGPKWKFLRQVCLYSLLPETYDIDMFLIFRDKWLFYAAYTPIWKERIEQYKGRMNSDKECIVFENEDAEEAFYDEYGYEPDEQSLIIQKRCLGINP